MKKFLAGLLCIFPATTLAAVELDAHMIAWSGAAEDRIPLGGGNAVTLAQTFTAGHTAPLVRVDLVIGCSNTGSGLVTVEIQDVDVNGMPDGTVFGGTDVDSGDLLSADPAIQEFPITGVGLVTGAQYAIVIRAEATVECVMPEGATGGFPFGYPDGEAYAATPADKPVWGPVAFDSGDDLPFWVYVHVPDPDEPRFCDIADYSGVPQTWELSADLPVCGCLRDSVLLHHRCWFSFPEWVVWREIPLPDLEPAGKATWWVTPMNSDFPGLRILENDLDGFGFGGEVVFDAGLEPGKAHKYKVEYQGQPTGTRVNFDFDIGGQPASVQFETVIDIPAGN